MPKWVPLENVACPVCRNTVSRWVCSKDKGLLWLSSEGVIQCQSGQHVDDLSAWRWKCSGENHGGGYRSADYEGWNFTLARAVLDAGVGGANWGSKLAIKLLMQFECQLR